MAGKATDAARFWARRPFDYGRLSLDRGQVFAPTGSAHDERLERLGYMVPLGRDASTVTCAPCGAEFIGDGERRGHGDKRHRVRSLDPREEDRLVDREERVLEQVAPLYLDKTAATRAG
jgi:hypothetical protein